MTVRIFVYLNTLGLSDKRTFKQYQSIFKLSASYRNVFDIKNFSFSKIYNKCYNAWEIIDYSLLKTYIFKSFCYEIPSQKI